ncbi:hypothetical protein [Colwellia piezophila]|uniref:hypothetical protein n=1 Tax=Colwellia piezophila TaxID=211668 RepID=UPI00036E2D15|nr:hypothetical protein [Colwellia piezophila]
MPFLQAVFCIKGFDDRSRFFATSMIALIGFIFCSALFSDYFTVNIIILLLFTAALACSTKRRLHDAKLNKNWQLVPAGLFLLTGILSLLIENSSSYYLLIVPALSVALLLTYPSRNNKARNSYIWGYYGPVDLNIYRHTTNVASSHSRRIEPTMAAGSISEQPYVNEAMAENNFTPEYENQYQEEYQADPDGDNKQTDIGELIRLKFLGNRKLQLGVIASVVLIIVAVLVNSLVSSMNQQPSDVEQAQSTKQQLNDENSVTNIKTNKDHLLEMPDNFNLYQSQFQGIIIHWQADQVPDGELWSQVTARGDKSCQRITFNKGSSLRPLSVSVENGSDYFASFSPLDSSELIQALAFRGKFSLCGYNFSLKGSQAVLGKHTNYAPFLDKDA